MSTLWESRWIGRVAGVLAAIVFVLAVIIIVMGAQNRSLQDRVAAGRADLAKAQTFANLDNSLVQLLAKTAADKNDAALKDLLAKNGVTFRVQANAAGDAANASGTAAQ